MKFVVKGKVWRWPSGNWHFIYIDKNISEKIKRNGGKRVGFGFVPVQAKLGKSQWRTTLFPTKEGPYLLSVNVKVRKTESVSDGDAVRITCELL